jgi:hypothetical protein
MSWDTIFIVLFTLVCGVSAFVALRFGVTWGGGLENFFSVRRKEGPFAFWFTTTLWLVFTALGLFGVYTRFAGWSGQT